MSLVSWTLAATILRYPCRRVVQTRSGWAKVAKLGTQPKLNSFQPEVRVVARSLLLVLSLA
eukprot:scaffold108579_cov35-Prasinocladus_malaysianus.AAC.1